MAYRVEIHRVAEEEIEQAYLWIASDSVSRANDWFDGLMDVIDSLRSFPERCALAPESASTQYAVRQRLHGPYRILFRIAGKTVQILHVVHGARLPLDEI